MLDNRRFRQAVRMRRGRRTKEPAARRSTGWSTAWKPAAGLPIPLKAAVVRRREANAIALPGGHIYVFEGLVKRSQQPRRTGRRHRTRDRPCRPSRRHALAAAIRRPVVSVRHAARRLHRRRRGGDRGEDGGAVGLFARGRGRRRSLWSASDDSGRRRCPRIRGILERIAGAIEPGCQDPARPSADQGPGRRHHRRSGRAAGRAPSRCLRRPNGRHSSESADRAWRAAALSTSRPRGWRSGRAAARCSRWRRRCLRS